MSPPAEPPAGKLLGELAIAAGLPPEKIQVPWRGQISRARQSPRSNGLLVLHKIASAAKRAPSRSPPRKIAYSNAGRDKSQIRSEMTDMRIPFRRGRSCRSGGAVRRVRPVLPPGVRRQCRTSRVADVVAPGKVSAVANRAARQRGAHAVPQSIDLPGIGPACGARNFKTTAETAFGSR